MKNQITLFLKKSKLINFKFLKDKSSFFLIATLVVFTSNSILFSQDSEINRLRELYIEEYSFEQIQPKLEFTLNLAKLANDYIKSTEAITLEVTLKNKYQFQELKLIIDFHKKSNPLDPPQITDFPFTDTITSKEDTLFLENHTFKCLDCSRKNSIFYVFTKNKNDIIVFISNIELKKGDDYFVNAYIKNSKDSISLFDAVTLNSNGKPITLNIEKTEATSFLDELIDKLFGTESILISIILFLITLLWSSLVKKINSLSEKFLDFLGRISIGHFAEKRFTKRYIDHITFRHKYLNLVGFNTAGISKPLLEDVFISLRVSNFDGSTRMDDFDPNGSKSLPFATAIKRFKKLVILGTPGAGKTTTLSYSLLKFAKDNGKQAFDLNIKLLPIFIPLRQLSHNTLPIHEEIINLKTTILPNNIKKECPKKFFIKKLEKGECLVLLDGLDEVTDHRTHKMIATKIDNMVSQYPDNYFLITCRIAGWQGLLNSEFSILETQNFSKDEIQKFVWGWHTAIVNKSEKDKLKLEVPDETKFEDQWELHRNEYVKPAIKKLSEKLMKAINQNPRILALAKNPMLLSLMALVHFNRATLPKGRTTLYKQCLELLIDAWDRKRDILSPIQVTATDKENILREIAFEFQLNGKGEDTRENLILLIQSLDKDYGYTPRQLLDDIEKRSGILIERQIGIMGFAHLTLQEYLVAIHIYSDSINLEPLLIKHADDSDWREVILLYSGMIRDVTMFLEKLILKDTNKGLEVNNILNSERILLASHCIGDSNSCEDKIVEFISSQLIKLHEEEKNNKMTLEKIEDAIASIALDFGEYAKNIREKLSEKLIQDLKNGK